MSAKTDHDYLRDMLEFAEDGHALIEGRTRDEMEHDNGLRYAVQYCLLVIGEAASHVSEATRAKLPPIPWRQVVGMRNWLVHAYSVIRTETLWSTAATDLTVLIDELLRFLPPEQT